MDLPILFGLVLAIEVTFCGVARLPSFVLFQNQLDSLSDNICPRGAVLLAIGEKFFIRFLVDSGFNFNILRLI